jgi:DNA/RNA endonuclease YhcR with UshA esterase domain
MLDDKSIMKICLAISITGIVLLVAVTLIIEPREILIEKIDLSLVGNNVKITGLVDHLTINQGNIFLTMNDSTGTVSVVVFERVAKTITDAYSIKKGDSLVIAGKITYYKSALEVTASSLRRV